MSMESILVPSVIITTTLVAYQLTHMLRRRPLDGFRVALNAMFECVGAGLLFLMINVAAGIAIVLTARSAGSQFVSLYAIDDVTLVILSGLQGLFFRFWWRM